MPMSSVKTPDPKAVNNAVGLDLRVPERPSTLPIGQAAMLAAGIADGRVTETPDAPLVLTWITTWAAPTRSACRPQEFGIHVHVHDGKARVVDDTFASAILNKKAIERKELIQSMINRTII